MSTMTQHAAGMFCWCQLGTSNPEAAKKFYAGLFGWTPEDTAIAGRGMTFLKKNGQTIAALYGMPKEHSDPLGPSWLTFVAVENADQTATLVKKNGGNVIEEPFDILDNGRMAVCQDPTRGTFALWQARKQIGAAVVNETGAMTWNELITDDAAKAGAFYRKVFGWTEDRSMPGAMGPYTVFKQGDLGAGGMLQATPEMHLTHPYWLVYFAVDDTDASAAKAQSLGAKISMKPTDIPKIGRFAVLTDPQGAWFAIIKTLPMNMQK